MEILGIGASELIFIVIIAIIVLGPKDMQKAGRMIGRWLNQVVQSDSWKIFQRTSSELRNLPRNLMREANMDVQKIEKDIRQSIDPRPRPHATPPSRGVSPSNRAAPPPQPPADTPAGDDGTPHINNETNENG